MKQVHVNGSISKGTHRPW